MVEGGTIDPETLDVSQVALVADYYQRPLIEYLDHLTDVRKRHGEAAAQLELEHGLALRELRIRKRNEAAEAANKGQP